MLFASSAVAAVSSVTSEVPATQHWQSKPHISCLISWFLWRALILSSPLTTDNPPRVMWHPSPRQPNVSCLVRDEALEIAVITF